MSLGNNISFLRKQKKLTQEQLADQMSVTRQTVSRWESDEVVPELDRLVAMCGLFACKLDALVREDLSDQRCSNTVCMSGWVFLYSFVGLLLDC